MKNWIWAIALTAASAPAFADTLLLDAIDKSAASGKAVPTRGASMADVSARFGEPAGMKSPVGQPPITRWVYSDHTVYFEGDRVIDVVIHRPTP